MICVIRFASVAAGGHAPEFDALRMTERLSRPQRFWQLAAGIGGGLGVIAGAVGAHAVPDATLAKLADTASTYQLIHAAALLWLSAREGPALHWARWLFLAGILLFCGTLYLKAFGLWPAAAALAPTGGVSFIAGWFVVAVDGCLW